MDLYTISEGQVQKVCSSRNRGRYYLLDDMSMLCEESGGAGYTLATQYSYVKGTINAIDGVRFYWDPLSKNSYWYRTPEYLDHYPEAARISENKAYAIWNNWKAHIIQPSLTELVK